MNLVHMDNHRRLALDSGSVTAFSVPLRAFLKLSYWLMTNLPLTRFLFFTGLLLLSASLLSWWYSPIAAFGFAMYAFITTLVLPYVAAVPLQRSLIASRRLVLVPGFALASGLTLFAMVILMSTALPLLAKLYGVGELSGLLGIRIFVAASFYAGILQICMVSRHAVFLLTALPLVMIVLLNRFESWMGMVWANEVFMLALFLLCLGGWLHALWVLRQRNAFRAPINRSGSLAMEQNAFQHQGSRWQPVIGHSPPMATLLHGYHASLPGKLLNLLYNVGVSPLVVAAVIRTISDKELPFMQLVFYIHLFMIATLPWAWGELAPRTRLVWLRMGGGRRALWRFLERSLLQQYLLMFLLTAVFLLLAWLQSGGMSGHHLSNLLSGHYLIHFVTTGAISLHVGYLSLMARLCYWPGWVQAVAMTALVLFVAVLLVTGILGSTALPALTVHGVLFALTLYYRHVCKRAFLAVDWIRLKPSGSLPKAPATA